MDNAVYLEVGVGGFDSVAEVCCTHIGILYLPKLREPSPHILGFAVLI